MCSKTVLNLNISQALRGLSMQHEVPGLDVQVKQTLKEAVEMLLMAEHFPAVNKALG